MGVYGRVWTERTCMKMHDIDKMLDPIPTEVLESNLLLDRALKHLGLKRVWRRSYVSAQSGFVILDKDNREYCRVKDALGSFDNWTINTLDELLDTAWFEHHHFALVSNPQNYSLVQNPFHHMSKEELAIQLDLLSEERESLRNDSQA